MCTVCVKYAHGAQDTPAGPEVALPPLASMSPDLPGTGLTDALGVGRRGGRPLPRDSEPNRPRAGWGQQVTPAPPWKLVEWPRWPSHRTGTGALVMHKMLQRTSTAAIATAHPGDRDAQSLQLE
jgi:hypothetical protein